MYVLIVQSFSSQSVAHFFSNMITTNDIKAIFHPSSYKIRYVQGREAFPSWVSDLAPASSQNLQANSFVGFNSEPWFPRGYLPPSPLLGKMWSFRSSCFANYVDKANNSDFLIEIETNPGPLNAEYTVGTICFLMAACGSYSATLWFLHQFIVYSQKRYDSVFEANLQCIVLLLFYLFVQLVGYYRIYTFGLTLYEDVSVTSEGMHDRRRDPNFLVGIEENPGPENFDFIERFLRNQENCKLYESKLKSLSIIKQEKHKNSSFNLLKTGKSKNSSIKKCNGKRQKQRNVALESKLDTERRVNRTFSRNTQRDRKYTFLPEGLFNVGLDVETKEFLQSFATNVADVIPTTIDVKFDFVGHFTQSVKDFIALVVKYGGVVKNLIGFVLSTVRELAAAHIQPFIDFVYAWFLGDEFHDCVEFKPESFLGHSLLMLAHRKYLQEYIDGRSFMAIAKDLLSLKKAGEGIEEVLFEYFQMLGNLINYLLANAGFQTRIPTRYSRNDKLNEFYARFKDLETAARGNDCHNLVFADKVFRIQTDMEEYLKVAEIPHYARDKVQYILRKINALVAQVEETINPNNGPRQEPLGIMICGPTGVGKSTNTPPILLASMSRLIEKDLREGFERNHDDYIFYRKSKNDFFDGLNRNHWALVYDDFGQQRDSVGNPTNEVLESIWAINSSPFHMHYSSIADKARHYMQVKMVYGTTNRKRFDFASIYDNKAVSRRFKIAYLQVPKEEFCVEKPMLNAFWERELDVDRLREKFPFDLDDKDSYFPTEACEYIPWDFLNGVPLKGPILNFEELNQKIVDEFLRNRDKAQLAIDFHQHIKTKYLERAVDDDTPPIKVGECPVDPPEGFRPESPIEPAGKDSDTLDLDKSLAANVVDKYKEWFRPITEIKYDRSSFETLAKIAGVIGAVFTVRALWKSARKIFFEYSPETPNTKADSNPTKKERQPRSLKKTTHTGKAKAQKRTRARDKKQAAIWDAQGGNGGLHNPDFIMKVVNRNLYRVRVEGAFIGYVLFIKDRTAIMPHHFIECIDHRFDSYIEDTFEDDDEDGINDYRRVVEFLHPASDRVAFAVDWDSDFSITFSQSKDIMFLVFGKRDCRSHSDIVGYFPSDDAFQDGNKFVSQLVCKRENNIFHWLNPVVEIGDNTDYAFDEGKRYKSFRLRYAVPTQPGDCGSPLITNDPRFKSPTILGFHTSAAASQFKHMLRFQYCAGVLVTRQFIESTLHQIELQSIDYDEEDAMLYSEEMELGEFVPECNISGFNSYGKVVQPRVATTSKIIPSPLFQSLWPLTTGIARLRPFTVNGETINPAEKARMKYSHDEKFVPRELLDDIFPYVARLVLKCSKVQPWLPRLFTLEEAIDGIDGVDFCKAVSRKTSAGYPFNLHRRGAGKKYWLGDTEKLDPCAPGFGELRNKVQLIIDKAKKGVRLTHVYMDCLKDERRPLEKIEAGKTRQFMACPMDYLVAFKMYFGDFLRYVCDNRINNSICVGIDPGTEWGELADYLSSIPEAVYTAGDYSSFDGRIRQKVLALCLEIVEQYYTNSTQEDRQVRYILFADVINSFHVSNGIIYEFDGGQASGNPGTAPLNSIVDTIMLYAAAWHKLHNEVELEELFRRSRVATYGDDNIISYHPTLSAGFDQDNLGLLIKEVFDMDYTIETKDGASCNQRKLEEINFLKRGFRPVEGTYVAPLDITVIKETLNWMHASSPPEEMTRRVDATLFELSLHGRKVFNELAPVINKASQRHLEYIPLASTYQTATAFRVGLNAYC